MIMAGGTLFIGLTAAAACEGKSGSESLFTVSQSPVTNTDFTRAAESTISGVVSIKSYATVRQQRGYSGGEEFFNDPFFDFFFGNPYGGNRQPQRRQQQPKAKEEEQQPIGLGSGVIISPDGYIVTNNHVIDGAERLEVTLNDNRQFNATVVGADPNTDLALIKIDAKELPVIPMGDSDALKVGEWVLAVGNPFGLTSTVTSGIVSAKARSISAATTLASYSGRRLISYSINSRIAPPLARCRWSWSWPISWAQTIRRIRSGRSPLMKIKRFR